VTAEQRSAEDGQCERAQLGGLLVGGI